MLTLVHFVLRREIKIAPSRAAAADAYASTARRFLLPARSS
jgi:hypothetical protein